jgi:hypothetical protein
LNIAEIKGENVETYKARTDLLISAYNNAYSTNSSKKSLLKFIVKSVPEDRFQKFKQAMLDTNQKLDTHSELTFLKVKLIKSSSFSIIEQQILKTFAAGFKKRLADLFLNSNDPIIQEKIKGLGPEMRVDLKSLSTYGYGVPLENEIISVEELKSRAVKSQKIVLEFDAIAKEKLSADYKTLEEITQNINLFNENSIKTRKEYRKKLENYILEVIHNLTLEESLRQLLLDISQGDINKVSQLRSLLDENLVNKSEILDAKLALLVKEELEKK